MKLIRVKINNRFLNDKIINNMLNFKNDNFGVLKALIVTIPRAFFYHSNIFGLKTLNREK